MQTSRADPEHDDRSPIPFLIIGLECDRPLIPSSRHCLEGVDELSIGRGSERVVSRRTERRRQLVSIQLPDDRLSSEHARVVPGRRSFLLEDLSSTNGSYVNGERVERHVLADGDVIELGRSLFVYREMLASVGGAPDQAPELGPISGLVTLDPDQAVQLELLQRIATAPVPVLILGETGTGKEVLARAVHELSKRPGPFVAVNCGAIPDTLVESQLFGHVKGAFTGAVRDETGFVRSAHNGTLFLDEIGELPAASQASLLRVLQSGEVVPLGSAKPQQSEIRVVAATHRPLEELMAAGKFRPDLYARLAGFTYSIPPLRERIQDLGLLISALLASSKTPSPERLRFRVEAARALYLYDWPLNVRELEQALATSSVLAPDGIIGLAELPKKVAAAASQRAASDELSPAEAQFKQELEQHLSVANGNLTEVARRMGKARQQVQRWIRRFGLDPDLYRA